MRFEQDAPFQTITIHLLDATPITEASIVGDTSPEAAEAEPEFEEPADDGLAEGVLAGGADDDLDDERDDEYARMIDGVDADVPVELERKGAVDEEPVDEEDAS